MIRKSYWYSSPIHCIFAKISLFNICKKIILSNPVLIKTEYLFRKMSGQLNYSVLSMPYRCLATFCSSWPLLSNRCCCVMENAVSNYICMSDIAVCVHAWYYHSPFKNRSYNGEWSIKGGILPHQKDSRCQCHLWTSEVSQGGPFMTHFEVVLWAYHIHVYWYPILYLIEVNVHILCNNCKWVDILLWKCLCLYLNSKARQFTLSGTFLVIQLHVSLYVPYNRLLLFAWSYNLSWSVLNI